MREADFHEECVAHAHGPAARHGRAGPGCAMARQAHSPCGAGTDTGAVSFFLIRCHMPTSLAVLAFLIFMSVLIAGYFYMQWAKGRESAAHPDSD
jgi:hypothetical protein